MERFDCDPAALSQLADPFDGQPDAAGTENDCPDPEGFQALLDSLYREHCGYLIWKAKALGCDPDHAEDAVHDAFRVALSRPDALIASPNRLGWLIRTMKYRLAHEARAAQYAEKLHLFLQDLYVAGRRDQIRLQILYSGLIREDELELLIRSCVERWPVRVLAADLGIREDSCRKRIQRAKERFADAYRTYVSGI